MRILNEFLDTARECSYLPDRVANTQYLIATQLNAAEYEDLINNSFRKFGQLLFRPQCQSCSACQPLRVKVADFTPNRSMQRCLARNQALQVEVLAAKATNDRIQLYNRYHRSQTHSKEWPVSIVDIDEYDNHFINSDILIEEISIFKENRLIAVMLFEQIESGLSLIYHFYDPDFKMYGLGTLLILKVIEIAKQRNKEFAYLGYFVANSKSMQYKAKFKPHQLLINGNWE